LNISRKKNHKIQVGLILRQNFSNWTGGKNYYINLIKELSELDNIIDLTIFSTTNITNQLDLSLSKCNIIVLKSMGWGKFRRNLNKLIMLITQRDVFLGIALRRHGIDILTHYNYFKPLGVKTASWIPDFQHYEIPENYSLILRWKLSLAFALIVKNSDYIFLSSNSMLSKFKEYFPKYCHKGDLLRFCHSRNSFPDIHNDLQIKERFIYIPNQYWIHKNHEVVIDAVDILIKKGEKVPIIVFSGNTFENRKSEHFEKILYKISEKALKNQFIVHGFISRELWNYLMINSEFVLNPSKYEGWSTIVEEAKAYKKTMLLSNINVHKEQCPGAIFFDPNSPADLANKIHYLLHSENSRYEFDDFSIVCIKEEYEKFISKRFYR